MGLSGQHFPGKTHSIEKIEFDDHFSAGIGHVNGGFLAKFAKLHTIGNILELLFLQGSCTSLCISRMITIQLGLPMFDLSLMLEVAFVSIGSLVMLVICVKFLWAVSKTSWETPETLIG